MCFERDRGAGWAGAPACDHPLTPPPSLSASSAKPKEVRERMHVAALTTVQVKSHLQKYRVKMARAAAAKAAARRLTASPPSLPQPRQPPPDEPNFRMHGDEQWHLTS